MDINELAELIDSAIAEGKLPYLIYIVLMWVCAAAAVAVAFFVFRAIGLYRINRRLGIRKAWLAFFPGFWGYTLGSAADALKKRKPSNYCIHMMMVQTFYMLVSAFCSVKTVQRFYQLYEGLRWGSAASTVELLERTMTVSQDDMVFFVAYYLMTILGYIVAVVSLLCFVRILVLFRSKGSFFLVLATAFVPQVMDIYLFVMRNKSLHTDPPVFRMPGMENFGSAGGEYNASDSHSYDENPFDGDGFRKDDGESEGENEHEDDDRDNGTNAKEMPNSHGGDESSKEEKNAEANQDDENKDGENKDDEPKI